MHNKQETKVNKWFLMEENEGEVTNWLVKEMNNAFINEE